MMMNKGLRQTAPSVENYSLFGPQYSQVNHKHRGQKTYSPRVNSLQAWCLLHLFFTILVYNPGPWLPWPTLSKQILLPSWFLPLLLAFTATKVWTTESWVNSPCCGTWVTGDPVQLLAKYLVAVLWYFLIKPLWAVGHLITCSIYFYLMTVLCGLLL